MGKNFIKIGRKSKRELNPVERYNRKLKEKKKLRCLIHKLNKRQDEPYQPKKRREESPEPEPTNDPMLQQLITAHSLRKQEEAEAEVQEQAVELPTVKQPVILLPTSLILKPTLYKPLPDDIHSSDSEIEPTNRFQYDLSVPKPAQPPKSSSQDYFKKLINRDDKLKEFYKRIGDLG